MSKKAKRKARKAYKAEQAKHKVCITGQKSLTPEEMLAEAIVFAQKEIKNQESKPLICPAVVII